ncbi:gustatory receptor for sugar taste 64f-like [Thrips palmi]|uniref:Gustatory receptor n=1 Tax=Thrips palmi TaxID=161013 RepID=A0A6P8YD45_THRPL|nr:gustatory receptor for sugar taste 64f-like [Thrips palmi]
MAVAPATPSRPLRRPSLGGAGGKQGAVWTVTSSASSASGSVPHTTGTSTFLRGLRPAALLAEGFGLLPVAKSSDDNEAVFRWRSLRVAYSLIIILGSFGEAVLSLMRMAETGVTFFTSVNVMFYSTSLATSLVFLRMSVSWRDTLATWCKLERFMTSYNGEPSRLVAQMKTMTFVVLVLALLEHVLSIVSTVSYVWPCLDRGGTPLLIEAYFLTKYQKTFTTFRFSFPRAIFLFTLQVITTFIWNFSDLFIILVSMGIGAYFRQLNRAMERSKGKIRHEEFWRQKREVYNALSMLTRITNDYVGPVVLISYASNLYFICLQLLVVTKRPPRTTHLHDVYFFYSLVYLIGRTCVMALIAADVYQESQKPRSTLFCVPTTSFCREVQRFLMQVNTDSIALSGCNFFSIDRSFMLTVAGTIVTYIVILVQFESPTSVEQGATAGTNVTVLACTCSDIKKFDC